MKCIFIIMYFFNEWIDSDKHVIDQIPENIGIIWEMRKTKTNEVLKGYSIQGKLMLGKSTSFHNYCAQTQTNMFISTLSCKQFSLNMWEFWFISRHW